MTSLVGYPAYTPHDRATFDQLPDHWEVVRGRHLVRIRTGSGDTVDAVPDGDYPFYVRSDQPLRSDRWEFETTAVLTAGDGAGVAKVFHLVSGRFMAHQRVYVLDEFRRVAPKFFYYAFSNMFRLMALDGSARSTVDSVRRPMIADMPFPVPPADEQRAIADFLDRETARIDTLVEEQQRLIDLLRERRASVVRNSVPDPRSGSVVADKLGRRTRIGNGSTPRRENQAFWDSGHIPWLNSSVVNQDRVGAATQFITDAAVAQCHLPLVPAGSVLVALTGQGKTRGMATVLDIEATINQHMAYVTPDAAFWESEYLLWSLTAAYSELRAISDENGSTKGALTCEELKRFRVSRPPLAEQRRIAARLDEQTSKIDTLIAESERFIELARERHAALITAAVTGQIDVSGEVA